MKKEHREPSRLIRDAFERKIRKNPAYSMRAFGRDIGMSPAFVSLLLKGKRRFPENKFELIATVLELDDVAKRVLREAVFFDGIKQTAHSTRLFDEYLGKGKLQQLGTSAVSNYRELSQKDIFIYDKWYFIAIMDLLSCANLVSTPGWIAGRLGIKEAEAAEALSKLLANGIIVFKDGVYRKTFQKIRFPTTKTNASVRRYHKQMIEKALAMLSHETSDEAFKKRLITAVTFSMNPNNLQAAKERLTATLFEIAELLMEGDCTEVYQLNAQLYPLTK